MKRGSKALATSRFLSLVQRALVQSASQLAGAHRSPGSAADADGPVEQTAQPGQLKVMRCGIQLRVTGTLRSSQPGARNRTGFDPSFQRGAALPQW